MKVTVDDPRRLRNLLAAARADLEDALHKYHVASLPIPMILTCPACGRRHIDRGTFAAKPHHTHACQNCGTVWRPAVVATVGVQFLPGFRDEEDFG